MARTERARTAGHYRSDLARRPDRRHRGPRSSADITDLEPSAVTSWTTSDYPLAAATWIRVSWTC